MNTRLRVELAFIGTSAIVVVCLGLALGWLPYWRTTTAYALEECFGQGDRLPTSVNCYKVCDFYLQGQVCWHELKPV